MASGVDRFLVVDVETTGLYNADRVVEVAAVTVGRSGEILDEWDSLVNPGRDIGPTHLHGVTASMVSAAPAFEEVAEALAARIHGAVLVAHNLAFDSRMLKNEYSRLGALLAPGRGVCTLMRSGRRLVDACSIYGIELHQHHRALADARATARLLFAAERPAKESVPAEVTGLNILACPRTLRREAVIEDDRLEMPYLARLAALSHHRAERGAALVYLDMLDWALHDLVITHEERSDLSSLASDLGMSGEDVRLAHQRYLRELMVAAGRDGRISTQEHALLMKVAYALQIDPDAVEQGTRSLMVGAGSLLLRPGMCVCFTGEATSSEGAALTRESLGRIARGLGLQVVGTVTKKGCELLVAADPGSMSGKSRKARGFGIPIAAASDFVRADRGGVIPTY